MSCSKTHSEAIHTAVNFLSFFCHLDPQREIHRERDLEGVQARFLERETFILLFNNEEYMNEVILVEAENKRRDGGGELI